MRSAMTYCASKPSWTALIVNANHGFNNGHRSWEVGELSHSGAAGAGRGGGGGGGGAAREAFPIRPIKRLLRVLIHDSFGNFR